MDMREVEIKIRVMVQSETSVDAIRSGETLRRMALDSLKSMECTQDFMFKVHDERFGSAVDVDVVG